MGATDLLSSLKDQGAAVSAFRTDGGWSYLVGLRPENTTSPRDCSERNSARHAFTHHNARNEQGMFPHYSSSDPVHQG